MLFCRLWITVGYLFPSETMASLLFSTCAFLWTPQPAITEQRSRPMEFKKKKKNTMEKFTFKKRDPKKKKISKFLCYYIESKQKRQAQKKNIKRVYGKAWEPGLGHGRRPFYFYFFYFHFFTIIIVFILYICFGGLTACSLGAWASLWSWDRIRTKGHADTREYRFELSSNRCRCLL